MSVAAPLRMIAMPVVVSPVKEISCTPGWATSGAPAVSPKPLTMLNTPRGVPAASMISASLRALSGDHSAGLSTQVLPAARQGATFQLSSMKGVFQGVTSPATPTGWRTE